MEPQTFEPMSVGRILDKTFQIYRDNFIRFITIVALVQVPLALVSLVSTTVLTSAQSSEAPPTREPTRGEINYTARFHGTDLAGVLVTVLLTIVGNMLCQAALIKSVSESYLDRDITVGQAYSYVLPKLLTLIGASLMVGLVVGFGVLLLVVPGVIFGLWFYLTTPAIVMEHLGAGAGMSRSRALVSGNLGKVFVVGLLLFLIGLVISIPFNIIAGLSRIFLWPNNRMLHNFIAHFAGVVAQILAMPIGASAAILLYYDLRIRKEGYDLEMLAQSMSPHGDIVDAGPG